MKTLLASTFILLLLLVIPLAVSGKEGMAMHFVIGGEKKISSQDTNCNYQSEDIWKSSYNFEYPKLILADNGSPLIAYVDINSRKLLIAEVNDQDVRIIHSQPSHDWQGRHRWPIIFTKDNRMYLLSFSKTEDELDNIKMFLFDRTIKQTILKKDITLKTAPCSLWGGYPYNDKFMLVSICDYICLRQAPLYLLGAHLPIYHHNASFIMDDGKEPERQSIEEKGCYNVFNQDYTVSTSGAIHAAWIRNTQGTGAPNHDEMVYYNINLNGTKWFKPVELYFVKNTESYFRLNNISLASFGNSAFVLWQDKEEGILFAEIIDGDKKETVKISDLKKNDIEEPLYIASTIKITTDKDGNVYTLWTHNSGNDYKLFFKARVNNKWAEEVVINKGRGYLYLPDMKIDKQGIVHITYIKPVDPLKPRKTYACYYMKIERR